MKTHLPLLTLALLLVLSACSDTRYQSFVANVPLYLSYEDLRSSVRVEEGRPLQKPGKIYFKDQYLLINEYREGIHVLDMSDPVQPVKLSFIHIPGNVDMAIRNHILYADSYTDLVLIDMSDPSSPMEMGRSEDLFEYMLPPYDTDFPLAEIDRDKGVVTGFEIKKTTQEIRYRPWPIFWEYDMLSSSSVGMGAPTSGASFGVGGSMARFIARGDYLYILENSYMLKTMDISDMDDPELKDEKYLDGNVETLFISDGHLYVGTSNGMHILSLENPGVPVQMSTYRHVTACDPVVVSGNTAYVTLRAGNLCGGDVNLLEVIDVTNKSKPSLLVSHPMTEPYGLGIDGSTLFVCEGDHGLKVYHASDPYKIPERLLSAFPSIHAYDVIPLDSLLFCIGEEGFLLYDYSNLQDIKLVSSIPVATGVD